MSISCTISSGSFYPPSHLYSFALSVLICDWWFHLYHHISYVCCFVASYLFLFWFDWLLQHYFMLLSREIQFLSEYPCFLVWYVAYLLLKTSIELFFFPFLFSVYCRSVTPHVISIVSGSCNQSSSRILYVVFKSLYRCVNAVFNTGKSSSSFFSWHIICQRHLRNVRPYAW